jgi:LPXTG-motif cell wall-anchored protein
MLKRLLGFTMLLMGAASLAMAGTFAPEIDPASGVAALALLSGGLLVLRGRRKK